MSSIKNIFQDFLSFYNLFLNFMSCVLNPCFSLKCLFLEGFRIVVFLKHFQNFIFIVEFLLFFLEWSTILPKIFFLKCSICTINLKIRLRACGFWIFFIYQGQWWSILRTQWPHRLQWCDLLGLMRLHLLHSSHCSLSVKKTESFKLETVHFFLLEW